MEINITKSLGLLKYQKPKDSVSDYFGEQWPFIYLACCCWSETFWYVDILIQILWDCDPLQVFLPSSSSSLYVLSLNLMITFLCHDLFRPFYVDCQFLKSCIHYWPSAMLFITMTTSKYFSQLRFYFQQVRASQDTIATYSGVRNANDVTCDGIEL